MENNKQTNNQQVRISDNLPGAEYANAMRVSHNKDEFQLIFFNVLGQAGKVSSKIVTTPGHLKRIIAALNDNLKKYEDQFGEIKETQLDNKEIGFKA